MAFLLWIMKRTTYELMSLSTKEIYGGSMLLEEIAKKSSCYRIFMKSKTLSTYNSRINTTLPLLA